jgi:hypothetical protein
MGSALLNAAQRSGALLLKHFFWSCRTPGTIGVWAKEGHASPLINLLAAAP